MSSTWYKQALYGLKQAARHLGALRTGERIAFNFLVSQKYTGEAATLDVLRDGASQQLDINLSRPSALVPLHLNNTDPSYVVIAGRCACCSGCISMDIGSALSTVLTCP